MGTKAKKTIVITIILILLVTVVSLLLLYNFNPDFESLITKSEPTTNAVVEGLSLDEKIFFLKLEDAEDENDFFNEEVVPAITKEAYDAGYQDFNTINNHRKSCEDSDCLQLGCYNCLKVKSFDDYDYAATSEIGRIMRTNLSHTNSNIFFIKYRTNMEEISKSSYEEGWEAARRDSNSDDPKEYINFLKKLMSTEDYNLFFVSLIPELKAEGYAKGYSGLTVDGIASAKSLKESAESGTIKPFYGIKTNFVAWAKKSSHPFFKSYADRIISIEKTSLAEGKKEASDILAWNSLSVQERFDLVSGYLLESEEVCENLFAIAENERNDFLYEVVDKICTNNYKSVDQNYCINTFKGMYANKTKNS